MLTDDNRLIGSRLLDRTLYLVRHRSVALTYDKLAEMTELQRNWIASFAQGKIEDPGVRKVEALYNALAEFPLLAPKD